MEGDEGRGVAVTAVRSEPTPRAPSFTHSRTVGWLGRGESPWVVLARSRREEGMTIGVGL